MIHALLILAAIAFVLWLLFQAAGAVIHLLWIVIVAALVIWAFRYLVRRGQRY